MKILLGILATLMLAINANSAIQVMAPTDKVQTGREFTVSIDASDATGIIAYQFNLKYDPEIIAPIGNNFGCSTQKTIAEGLFALCNVSPEGTLRTVIYGAVPLFGRGPVLNIRFVAHGLGQSDLRFENVYFFDSFGPVVTQNYDGMIKVTRCTSRRC